MPEQQSDFAPTPERDLARVLCDFDKSWAHHGRTDDHPCSACLIVARTHLAAARADERERVMAMVEMACADAMRGNTHRGITGNHVSVAVLYAAFGLPPRNTPVSAGAEA